MPSHLLNRPSPVPQASVTSWQEAGCAQNTPVTPVRLWQMPLFQLGSSPIAVPPWATASPCTAGAGDTDWDRSSIPALGPERRAELRSLPSCASIERGQGTVWLP